MSFDDDDITNMALKILSELTKVTGDSDLKFITLLRNKKIHLQLIEQSFKVNQEYKETYTNYLKSSMLMDLFDSSSELLQLPDNNIKKKFVYSRLKTSSFDKEINRYAEYENIPLEFASLSINRNCIKHLVGFFLKKHIKTHFTTEVLNTCEINSSEWLNNNKLLTPYERVGQFQNYLYSICDRFNKNKLQIPSKLMRIILSTARLHLILMDENNLNPNDLKIVLKKQKEAHALEEINGHEHYLKNAHIAKIQGKKYIKNWRKRHLRPFLIKSDTLDYIANLNDDDPMFDVKLVLLVSRLLTVSSLLSCDFSGYES